MSAKAESGLEVGVGGLGVAFDAEAVLGNGRRDLSPRRQQPSVDHEHLRRTVRALHHRLDQRQGRGGLLLAEKRPHESELEAGVGGGHRQGAAVFDFGLVSKAVGEERIGEEPAERDVVGRAGERLAERLMRIGCSHGLVRHCPERN